MTSSQHQEVISYSAGWTCNGLSWSQRHTEPESCRFAVSSYTQDYKNNVDIVQKDDSGTLVCAGSWEHCYPPTKIMFAPAACQTDIIVTTADYLRVWDLKEGAPPPREAKDETVDEERQKELDEDRERWARKAKTMNTTIAVKKVFDSGKPTDFCSPITSCDWNADDPNMVGVCSVDTTVTIWDLETAKATTQLIAHDKDVYDIAFAKGTHAFASCGADGSVRIFDLREMEHCTIVHESPQLTPLLRVAWNKLDQTYLATFGVEGTEVVVIDIRYTAAPVGFLRSGHTQPINSICWAPHSATHLCSAGEDGNVFIWDLTDLPNVAPKCLYNYKLENPINSIGWSPSVDKHIAITSGKEAQLLYL